MRTVNQTMVYTYYEIGRMIVEDEQQGKERAEYGKQMLKDLSGRLAVDLEKGFRFRTLKICENSISFINLMKNPNQRLGFRQKGMTFEFFIFISK